MGWNMPQDIPQRSPSTVAKHKRRAASVGHASRPDVDQNNSPRKPFGTVTGQVSNTTASRNLSSPSRNRAVVGDLVVAAREQSRVKQLFDSKRESRRRRQSLKESGDFLGVQGVNPETGEMDVLTPTTSSGSTRRPGLSPTLGGLAQRVRDTEEAYR